MLKHQAIRLFFIITNSAIIFSKGNILSNKCPEPKEGFFCTAEYQPVQCGDMNCIYSNLCVANLADFKEDECSEMNAPDGLGEECPLPESGKACAQFYDLVHCGDKNCQYSNMCIARAAGFEPKECDRICPDPTDAPCTKELKPVTCGLKQCYYGNKCIAARAGFPSGSCRATARRICKLVPNETVCPEIYRPVLCGFDFKCEYENWCLAKAAGMAGNTKCRLKKFCPPVPEGNRCTKELKPIQCGWKRCEYDNWCQAKAAGMTGKGKKCRRLTI